MDMTITTIVILILVAIIFAVTNKWNSEEIEKKRYKEAFEQEYDEKESYIQENNELKDKLISKDKDIQIIEDTYNAKIDKLESEIDKVKKETEKATFMLFLDALVDAACEEFDCEAENE